MAEFLSYTMPAEAQDYDLGDFFTSRGNITTQRNNWTVDWTRRKWYRLGYRWLADYSDVDTYGLWVGDLDDLTDMTWLPFDTSSFDPDAHANFHSYIGLVSFEGTKYLGVSAAHSGSNTRIDHLLIDSETGKFVASATASNPETAANTSNFPFLLPTSDPNIWHRFDMAQKSLVSFPGTTRWAVIEYNLTAETVTILVDYELVPAGIQDISGDVCSKGRTASSFNTVFVLNPAADDGRIYEITIPHVTTSDADLSFTTFKTVTLPADHAVLGVYYATEHSRLIYAYRRRIGGGGFPDLIRYEVVKYAAPSTVIWTDEVDGNVSTFSELHPSSYVHYRVSGCTCIDFLEGKVIDINRGDITDVSNLLSGGSNDVQGLKFSILDMETNKVWDAFKEAEIATDLEYITNNFVWPDPTPSNEVPFVQAYTLSINLLYLAGACNFGISFGEEKDPTFVDFASFV
jgi:hypothetical protein